MKEVIVLRINGAEQLETAINAALAADTTAEVVAVTEGIANSYTVVIQQDA